MTKKTLTLVVLTVLFSMLLTASILAVSKDKAAADKISGYNVPQHEFTPRNLSRDISGALPGEQPARRSILGQPQSSRGISVGEIVDHTYEDRQWWMMENRHIAATDVGGLVDVHFVYDDCSDTAGLQRSGYNVWDATDSGWPQGQDAGCLLQPSAERGGRWVGLAAAPNGLAAMSVCMDWEGEFTDTVRTHDFWFQNLRHNCTWTQSWVPSASYSTLWQSAADLALFPSIATQEVGGQTVLHCALSENGFYNYNGTTIGHHILSYWRKVGVGSAGTWTDGQVIDTMWHWSYRMLAQQNGSKVAVIWTNTSDSGFQEDQAGDNDVFYRESNNAGVDWGPEVNVTDYSSRRLTEITSSAAISIEGCYDDDGYLHILWAGDEVPVMPYRNGYNWNDFNADLFHWSNAASGPYAGGNISKVADGTYDPMDNKGYWNVRHCGFGPELRVQYIDLFTISQCGEHMYILWNQMHHRINSMLPGPDTANAINDCSADERENNANFEVFVSVSSSTDGLLWDPQRNLTNTYTPNCHPDSGIVCGDEFKPTMSLQALEDDGSLEWPDNEVIPGGGSAQFISDKWLQVMFLEDEVPGSWWVGDTSGGTYPTYNAMKWFRMACVEPVGAAIIEVSQGDVRWPEFVINGSTANTYHVTITNTGNLALTISDVDAVETSGSGWLTTTMPPATIPAGVGNTGTFDITVTPPAHGTPAGFLTGTVTINSNADNNPAFVITFDVLAADKVYDVQYDTVATSTAWDSKAGKALGDNVALTVSNFGEIGNAGFGGVGLDFVVDGDDCDTTITHYLYTGSPYYLDNSGAEVLLTSSHYASSGNYQGESESWDPADSAITGGLGTLNGKSYDYVYAGKSYNRDSSVAIERTIYAPRDNAANPSFVLTKTLLYSLDGSAREGISFGHVTDWDVPSDDGSTNTSGVTQPTGVGGLFVYFRGTDTAGSDACQSNLDRYATEAVAGYYLASEYEADECVNHDGFYASLGVDVREYFDDVDGGNEPDAQVWWDLLGNNPGLSGMAAEADQGGIVSVVHDYTLPANDTLVVWTVLATMHSGTLAQFEANVADAKSWYMDLRACGGCCQLMGNVDGEGDVTMGDLTVLIDHLFISYNPLVCADEGNVDLEGDVTMGDLTVLIDNLFISYEPLPDCSELP